MAIIETFFMLASPVLKIEVNILFVLFISYKIYICLPVSAEKGNANTYVVIQDLHPGELHAVLSATLNLLMCKIIFCYAVSV